MIKIGIIGLGLIGLKRYQNLPKKFKLVGCSDINKKNYFKIDNYSEIPFFYDWKKLLLVDDIDAVIISTPHNQLYKIAIQALKNKKHIFVEKPVTTGLASLKKLINYSKKKKKIVRVGFNHRYLESIIKAKKLIDKKQLGKIMFAKGSYGHGARLNYDKEWRMLPKMSGGGELIDQGSHFIDLGNMFFGKIKNIESTIKSFYWKKNVDDNNFVILNYKNNSTFMFHTSCTEWKNTFRLEIYGKTGKILITGKGGSYGKEELIFYKMKKKLGVPNQRKWKFNQDTSWGLELNEFYKDIKSNRNHECNLETALKVMQILKKIYKQNNYDYCS